VECGCLLGEDETQAVRRGWWSNGVGDLYPFCEECARREFGGDATCSGVGRELELVTLDTRQLGD
jgi:hypothetical protein